MTRQGKAIRARRRALAGGAAAAAVAAVLAARFIAAPGPAPNANTVTLNAPNPSAPGGVFASGTAAGKPWRLAVRNIADPGTRRCLPAVMLNGRDGNVLFGAARGEPVGHPALLRGIPGLPGIGAMVTQVAPGTTRLVVTLPGGRELAVRPVRVPRAASRSTSPGSSSPAPRMTSVNSPPTPGAGSRNACSCPTAPPAVACSRPALRGSGRAWTHRGGTSPPPGPAT